MRKTLLIGLSLFLAMSGSFTSHADAKDSDLQKKFGSPYYWGEVIPTPQQAEYKNKFLLLADLDKNLNYTCIMLESKPEKELNFAAEILRERFAKVMSSPLKVVSGGKLPENIKVCIKITNSKTGKPAQGYKLNVSVRNGVTFINCTGNDTAGAFYAAATLNQLLKIENGKLYMREADITDWPFTLNRCVGTRGRITPETYLWAAEYKLNKIYTSYGKKYWEELDNIPKPCYRELYGLMKSAGMINIGHMVNPYCVRRLKEIKSKRKINIADPKDVETLIEHFRKALSAGAVSIMLATDDFMDRVNSEFVLGYPEERKKFKTVENAHIYLANKVYDTLIKEFPQMDMSFCPPYYASHSHVYRSVREPQIAKDYLSAIGKGFNPKIKIILTGPQVASSQITEKDFQDMAALLSGRLPHIWDNSTKLYIGVEKYFVPFTTSMPPKYLNNYEYFNSCIDANPRSLSFRLIFISVCDKLWNPAAYNADKSFRSAISSYFGREMVEPLLEFGKLCNSLKASDSKEISPLKKRLFFEDFAPGKKFPYRFYNNDKEFIQNQAPLPPGRHLKSFLTERGYILRKRFNAFNIPLDKTLKNGELRFWWKSPVKATPLRVILWCDNDKKSYLKKEFTSADDEWHQYTVPLINMAPILQNPPAKAITGIGFYSTKRLQGKKASCLAHIEIGLTDSSVSLVEQKKAAFEKMRKVIKKIKGLSENRALEATLTGIYEKLLKDFSMILQNSAKPLAVKSCKGKITIDGKLDEAAWKEATPTSDFVSYKNEKIKITKTYAKVTYTADNLYIGFFCKAEKWDDAKKIPQGAAGRDSETFKCDSVEIFLDPGCTRKKYYQFGANVIGGFLDKEVGYDNLYNRWNPDWQVKTFKGKDFWSVEIAIPLNALKLKNKQLKGSEWGANFCRTNVPKNELGVWKSLNGKSFHSPALWGKIIFK
ncbi:MAG: beta-N-acetylglucosaminidase domain-containing protein [Victivallaceae bacterium]|nr:beta-N-acetylglucosaminidase domain-containing protein [Victivallaceae bacterium]